MGLFIGFAFLYLFLVFYFEMYKQFSFVKFVSLLLGGSIFYVLLYNVTHNNDWDMYEAIYRGELEYGDLLFNFISQTFNDNGYDYQSVYKFHIFIIGVGIIYFASRNSYSNVFAIITTYLLFQLIPISNQIRYFVAFPFFLIAVYQLIVCKNKIIFIVLSVLSFLSHSAIFLMFPFLYVFYYVKDESYIRILVISSIILAAFFYLVFFIGFVLSFHFGSYFETEFISSFSGGIFNNFIWIFWILFMHSINKRLQFSTSELINADTKYQFYYKLSLYCILFFPVSVIMQVISHRYIAASLVVWLSYFFYSLQYEESNRNKIKSILMFFILNLFTFFYVYVLPTYVLGISATEIVFELFLFNEFFYQFLW